MGTAEPVTNAQLRSLEREFRGELLRPADDGYEARHQIWNAMAQKRPELIACCTGPADVQLALAFARDNDRTVAIRCGGHNAAGKGTCGDVVLDLSGMDYVRVDPDRRTARIGGGLTWRTFDRETVRFGLATPGGVVSATGVSGLALGGGIGWLSREHGLTCDNILSMDVVLANGEQVVCDAERHSDLFWALRGGGGNFGVVTSFEFALHPIRPLVLGGISAWDIDQLEAVLAFVAEFGPTVPDQLTINCIVTKLPALPMVPEEIQGSRMVLVGFCWTGDLEEGERVLAPLRSFGTPTFGFATPLPYVAQQSLADGAAPFGHYTYQKSGYLDDLSPGVIAVAGGIGSQAPSELGVFEILLVGGEIARRPVDSTAYGARSSQWQTTFVSHWEGAVSADTEAEYVEWVRNVHREMAPHSAPGVYVNFLGADDAERVSDAYTPSTYERLTRIKAEYDPDNFFRVNQNIVPATVPA